MKKIYLATAAMALAGAANAQYAHPNGDVLTPFTPEKSIHETHTAFDRGGAFWTEDFSNGMASSNGTWTVGDVDGNIWKHDFVGTSGCYSNNTPTPSFSSAFDGFMLFDIDSANCVNPTTTPPTITQNDKTGELISPSINCGSQGSVNLVFEHTMRFCCVTPTVTVEVSNDGGTTWTPFDVVDGVAVNANAANPVVKNINITSVAANQTNVMIKFRWTGSSHYYWAIDDIALMPSPAHEMAFVDSWYRSENLAGANTVPYTMIPTGHTQDFRSFATITNQGGSTESTTFQSDLYNGTGFEFQLTSPAVSSNGGDTYSDSSAVWTNPTTAGSYELINYFNYADLALDNDMSNNVDTFDLWVTDSVYGRDDNAFHGGLWNGAGNAYEMGPVYRPITNDNLAYLQVAFGTSTVPGTIVYAVVYQIDQTTGDFNPVFNGSGTANSEITLNAAQISTTGNPVWINIPIDTDGLGTPLAVTGNEEYIVCIGHYGGPDDVTIMSGGITAPDQTVFLLSGVDNTWYYMTSTPSIRMMFSDFSSVDGISENNPIGLEMEQNYPNPTNGITTIAYSLEQAADVTFTITDVTGKVILTSDEGTVVAGEHTFEMNTAKLAEGMYNYTINANGITITKHMVVKH